MAGHGSRALGRNFRPVDSPSGGPSEQLVEFYKTSSNYELCRTFVLADPEQQVAESGFDLELSSLLWPTTGAATGVGRP